MECKKALKIPFKVDKDNLVSWTEFSPGKRRHCDSQHKNGSMLFDHNLAAKITLEFKRKKPCVMLKDILKTECGRAHLDRIKQSCNLGNQTQGPCTPKECGHHKEEPSAASRDRTPYRISANKDRNKNETPKFNKKTTTSSSQRSQHRRRSQNVDDEAEKEEKAIDGKACEEDYKFAEIVDCGFSMRWEPSKDTEECPEFSPASMKETWTDPEKEVLQGFKRRKKPSASPCNGTSSPKRRSESVLRLSGGDRQEGKSALSPICLEDSVEDGGDGGHALANVGPEKNRENDRDGEPLSAQVCLEESEEVRDLENVDHSVVQFTVGADDPRDYMSPVVSPSSESGDFISTSRQSLSPNQDVPTTTSPSEPIVLSSDDEEGCVVSQRSSQAAHKLASLEDAVTQEESAQEDKPQEASDTEDVQLYQVFLGSLPPEPVSILPNEDYTSVAFSSLYSGAYHFKSNGHIMIADQKIFIHLKDVSDRLEAVVTFEGKEMRWYSVWELQEMEAEELFLKFDMEPPPPTVLLLCVSEAAAAAIQQELFKLCEKHSQRTNTGDEAHTVDTGRLSPFILLTLREPLDGIEGTLFRSLLELDCHRNPEAAKPLVPLEEDGFSGLTDLNSHVLPVADSIRLIRGTGLDSHLLSLLGLDNANPSRNSDQDDLFSDTDQNQTVLVQVARDSKKGTALGLESVTVSSIQVQTEEDQKDQTLEALSENKQEEPTSVYTLCHRRTRGSYSVSLCKPDSSWTKYRHQSVARRLIQFPPPPLKGGITVTMEDLQCLDSGQFLNDVIIDFYLKYLLHKAPAAVAERTHIFSSFFYKQLTRRDNASEGSIKDSCQRQRRHQRVKTWTRHVDIFQKDFLFVPVNQEAHWYLVVICFPGLMEPSSEAWNGPCSPMGKSDGATDELQEQESAPGSRSPDDSAEASPTVINSVGANTETEKSQEESTKNQKPVPVSCTERTCQRKTVCKRPCILVMDSLKRSLHERVFKLLRDYLESEWEVRRGSPRDFGADQMQNSHCRVPLQDNSSDCGLYLLQYVESFLEDPVVHFDLPLHLERWFPRQQVRRKRDEIRDLVLNLYRRQNLDSNR